MANIKTVLDQEKAKSGEILNKKSDRLLPIT